MDLPLWLYPLLFLTGFAAGLVDAVAGGGGLIAVPVLLNLGLPVPVALGTSKLQSSFGRLSASVHYLRQGVVRLRDCRVGIVASATGSLMGAAVIHAIDSRLLEQLIPWLLAAIVLYAILQPRAGSREPPTPAVAAVLHLHWTRPRLLRRLFQTRGRLVRDRRAHRCDGL